MEPGTGQRFNEGDAPEKTAMYLLDGKTLDFYAWEKDGESVDPGEELLPALRGKIDAMADAWTREQKDAHSLPLSINGQVDRLIKEATSELRLSQMYIGWMPFM